MAAPTNIDAATAVVIPSLPYSVTQTGIHDSGTTYTVWYQYTAGSSDVELSVFGFGDLVTYKPRISVLTGVGATPYLITSAGPNVPVQIPVVSGDTYWFKFAPNAANPNPATLTLDIETFVENTVPIGSIAINDDSSGFPLVILSSDSDNTALKFMPDIAAGEAGDILPTGELLLENISSSNLLTLYDENYAELASITAPENHAISTNKVDTFYAASAGGPGDATVITVSKTGVVGSTTWTLTGEVSVRGIAPDPTETILYLIQPQSVSTKIKRWDLVNDVALLELVDLGAVLPQKCLLCLDDGSVIAMIRTALVQECRRYNSAGSLLSTYSLDRTLSDSTDDRMAYGVDDTTFWVWQKGNPEFIATISQIRVSDGVVLTTRSFRYFEGGIFEGTATATPDALFGPSFSCPFWITRTAVTPTPPSALNGPAALAAFEADGTMRDYRIVWSRRAPHMADEGQRVFYSKFQLDLEAGVGTVSGQGVTPTCELRWSNDGGFTWSGWRQLSMGPLGQYKFRAIAYQLGQARDRVFEVRGSDPVKVALLQAYLEVQEGSN